MASRADAISSSASSGFSRPLVVQIAKDALTASSNAANADQGRSACGSSAINENAAATSSSASVLVSRAGSTSPKATKQGASSSVQSGLLKPSTGGTPGCATRP